MLYPANQIRSTQATVALSPAGAFTIYSGSTAAVDVVVDVLAYTAPDADNAYVPITPTRITDTRTGSGKPNAGHPLTATGTLSIATAGVGGIPTSGVTGIVAEVTATDTTGNPTYLTAYATGSSQPTGDTLYAYGAVATNEDTIQVNSAGQFTLYNRAGTTNVLVDVVGYYYKPTTTTYSYNADGLRESSTTANKTTHYTWDTAGELPELLSDDTNTYIYGPAGLPLEQIATNGTITWLHHDQLGNTRLLTTSSGASVGTYTYTPYGQTVAHSGSATTPLQYGDGYTETDSGLVYLQHRYYDPSDAQFLSVDPEVTLTDTVYNYVFDNPLNDVDPSGLCSAWNPVCDFHVVSHFVSEHRQGIEVGAGIVLGVAAAATGVGAAVEIVAGGSAALAAGLGASATVAGLGAAALDYEPCVQEHDGAACAGLSLGVAGASLGALGAGGAGGVAAGLIEEGGTADSVLQASGLLGTVLGVGGSAADIGAFVNQALYGGDIINC